ncbi:S9 family peptidase [uncultured Sunxiuqinia sp.]|uniref:S9 family peptidase n=1 Tax=uncultured Sunxiuqinia sp. TaxID=1573825 RepID=UPI002AA7ED90|nr:S9 family peptidase [uncultured Sunxiuqinia sp.]
MKKSKDRNKRPFSVEDHYKIKNVGSPQISPDGKQILYVITSTDASENCRKDQIALLNIADKHFQILVEGSSPVWSPTGLQIAFEANKDGKDGIWIYDLEDSSENFLTPIYHSSYFINHLEDKSFKWSPNGKQIAYVSTLPTKKTDDKKMEVMVTNRLLYMSKGGRGRSYFVDESRMHLWTVSVDGGVPKQLTFGEYDDHSLHWSPDSLQIAFISNRTADPDNNQYCDLWKVNTESGEITRLTHDLKTAFQPRWSSNGEFVAYLGTSGALSTNDSQSDDTHLYIVPGVGGESLCLTKAFDRRIENINWHPLEETIFFNAGNHGRTPLFQIHINSGKIKTVIEGDCHILDYSISSDAGRIAYLHTDIVNPPEIFTRRKNQTESTQISNHNEALLQECLFQDVKEFWVKSFDGVPVQGWIMKPVLFNSEKTYPLILVIHGGPHNMFGYDFEERMQLLSAHGYGVLFMNPRGSHGYGQAFSNGNLLNWGGGDYKDLMAGVDYVINKYKWIDKERLGVTGQSYGGYMGNWIITQTNRFKAAVVDGGISNLVSFAGTSIYHSLTESEFNGSAYDNFELIWQWSPLKNVKKVTTPTLFLHGEIDNEVPVTQAEEMYVALKKLGVETTLVQYLGEGHGWRPDLKPNNRVDLGSRMLSWFDKYL